MSSYYKTNPSMESREGCPTDNLGNPAPGPQLGYAGMHTSNVEPADGRDLTRMVRPPATLKSFHQLPHHRSHPKQLYVVSVVSNPIRFKSRYKLFKEFERHMSESGVELITVEIAFGDRHFAVTSPENPKHVQVRGSDELWHKENLVNLGFKRVVELYPDAEYLAWIDADVTFLRHDWANETLHQLQHYQVVQMFQNAIDLGPDGEAMKTHTGFAWSYLSGARKPCPGKGYHYNIWHPGYAWAIRREALDALGGLYDLSVLGSGDHLMAWALLGEGHLQLPKTMAEGYHRSLKVWQDRAERFVMRDLGCVHGTLAHSWHGRKEDRNYKGRWVILEDRKFDPYTDLKYDSQGLLTFNMDGTPRMLGMLGMLGMRNDFRRYFRERLEDATDRIDQRGKNG